MPNRTSYAYDRPSLSQTEKTFSYYNSYYYILLDITSDILFSMGTNHRSAPGLANVIKGLFRFFAFMLRSYDWPNNKACDRLIHNT